MSTSPKTPVEAVSAPAAETAWLNRLAGCRDAGEGGAAPVSHLARLPAPPGAAPKTGADPFRLAQPLPCNLAPPV